MVTEIVQKTGCGWCNTNDHKQCVGWIKSYDTIWICGCKEPGCGVDSPRNTRRIASRSGVQVEETGSEPEGQPVTADQADAGSAGSDREPDTDDKPVAGARRGRKPKGVAVVPTTEAEN